MAAATARRLAVAMLVLAALAVAILLAIPASQPTFSVVVPAATNLVTGNRVTDASNNNIGGITGIDPVDGGRRARLTIEIKEDRYWPMKASSKLEIRYGGTVSFSNRYIRVTQGSEGPNLRDGGELAAENVDVPVEIDELVNEFTPDVRADITDTIRRTSFAIGAVSDDVDRLLPKTPPLARNLNSVFVDLLQDKQALRTLVQSTQRTVAAVDRADPDLRVLLDGAATTFDAIAAESDDLRVALDRFPGALRQTRTTLDKASPVLRNAADLTDELEPGIAELRRTTQPLVRTLATLRDVTPMAERALAETHQEDLRQGADLLRTAGNFAHPRVASMASQLSEELKCVRPYIPEIVMLGSVWGDWISPVDEKDHVLRATLQSFLPAQFNSLPLKPADADRLYDGLEYGFPRPPGALAGQEWHQPECGAGPEAQDPAQDQEGEVFADNQIPPELRP